jgi:hypothetical protein
LRKDSEGNISLDLLSARLGPGTYEADTQATTFQHRAPEADFGHGGARFSYDLAEELANGGKAAMRAGDLDGDRVWLDLQKAVVATRHGVIENKHSTGVASAHPSPRICMSIHPYGKSCSGIGRVLVLHDPLARPNVNVGGLMDPEHEEHTVEMDPYWDALYDAGKGEEFLRKAGGFLRTSTPPTERHWTSSSSCCFSSCCSVGLC